MSTHKQYLAYEYEQCKVIQDIREIELINSGSNANTEICFKVRASLQTEKFSLYPHRTFHKRTSTEELQLYTGSTQLLSLTQTSTQDVGTEQSTSKGKYTWWSRKSQTISLGDLKRSQTIFSQYKDPKNRFEMIAQVCEKTKYLKIKQQRKYLEKTSWWIYNMKNKIKFQMTWFFFIFQNSKNN